MFAIITIIWNIWSWIITTRWHEFYATNAWKKKVGQNSLTAMPAKLVFSRRRTKGEHYCTLGTKNISEMIHYSFETQGRHRKTSNTV